MVERKLRLTLLGGGLGSGAGRYIFFDMGFLA